MLVEITFGLHVFFLIFYGLRPEESQDVEYVPEVRHTLLSVAPESETSDDWLGRYQDA